MTFRGLEFFPSHFLTTFRVSENADNGAFFRLRYRTNPTHKLFWVFQDVTFPISPALHKMPAALLRMLGSVGKLLFAAVFAAVFPISFDARAEQPGAGGVTGADASCCSSGGER